MSSCLWKLLVNLTPVWILLVGLVTGCGGGGSESGPEPEQPAVVSLTGPGGQLDDGSTQSVDFTINLAPTVASEVTVSVTLAGTATRDLDYRISSTTLTIPARQSSGSLTVTSLRDFDIEGDETIEVMLSSVTGNAELGTAVTAEVQILDGPDDQINKQGDDAAEVNLLLIIFPAGLSQDSLSLQVIVVNESDEASSPTNLILELADSKEFTENTVLNSYPIRAMSRNDFPEYSFYELDLASLDPGLKFVRARLEDIEEEGEEQKKDNIALLGFEVGEDQHVVTTCQTPERPTSVTADDPLTEHSWHLKNTGQSAFSVKSGIAGEDLRMDGVLADGPTGVGVEVVVFDTGMEICHPDLATNSAADLSYNFDYLRLFGSKQTDPYLPWLVGDHGTSVAGVIGAAANNGVGGRGVAPGVNLRAFSGIFFGDDASALGASMGNPDSASGHIFNMSYGTVLPGFNSFPDEVALYKFGTSELRSGLGALYIKAGGNAFELCSLTHPLNSEIGCSGSVADPIQNLPYLITVGAFDANGVKSSYSSAGSNLWVVAPAGLDGIEEPGIITTDQKGREPGYYTLLESLGETDGIHGVTENTELNPDGDYTSLFGGTSSAAPATVGAIAVMLEANPDLAWRDIKHILASTARQIDADIQPVEIYYNDSPYMARLPWIENGAGYQYHNFYGFGAVALDDAVGMARTYTPDSLGEFVESEWFATDSDVEQLAEIPDRDGAGITQTLVVENLPDSANIEAAVLSVSLTHPSIIDLGIHLTSPSGTESILNPVVHTSFLGETELNDWHIMSNAFYGENPNGEWTIKVVDVLAEDVGMIDTWELRFYYGTHP